MKEVISRVIDQELKDPRRGFITVVGVKIAPDLKTARVHFSVLGSDAQKRTATRALDHARGFIQGRVAQDVSLKYTPVITFHLDESAEREIALSQTIGRVVRADARARAARLIRERIAAGSVPADVVAEVARAADSREFCESIATLLSDLLGIDTSGRADLAGLAADERRCLESIERALHDHWADEVLTKYVPVIEGIEGHPSYRAPAYTGSEQPYEDRASLAALLPRSGDEEEAADEVEERPERLRLTFQAHVGAAGPHAAPERRGDELIGTGCAGKAQAVMVVAAFHLLRRVHDRFGLRPARDLCAHFVVDEGAAGNAGLALAFDEPFPSDGLVVCAPTALRVLSAAAPDEPPSPLAVYAVESCGRAGLEPAPEGGPATPHSAAAFFADLLRGREIVVFGPGRPDAGPGRESMRLQDIAAGARMLAFLVLDSAGFVA